MHPFSRALDLSRVADLALVRDIVGHLAAGTLKVIHFVVVRNGRAFHTSKIGYSLKKCQTCIKAKYLLQGRVQFLLAKSQTLVKK